MKNKNPIKLRKMNFTIKSFEKWAKRKGMLIDKDINDNYKSLETRAYFDTWQSAQQSLEKFGKYAETYSGT